MRKHLVYSAIGVVAAVATAAIVCFSVLRASPGAIRKILAAYREGGPYGELTITAPLDQTLFPPESAPPTFRWKSQPTNIDTWLVTIEFLDGEDRLNVLCSADEWTPSERQWKSIKSHSQEKAARVTVLGVQGNAWGEILAAASISIRTSNDEVGAPIFYREVNLPFLTAVKDPAAFIRWRFGEVSSREPPPIVLEKLPVCGNCHSFAADGSTLAMEVDSGNEKGSFVVAPVEKEIVLDTSKIMTWSDYRREDNQTTFGLLCQVSPDGRHVVGTVKDRALAVYRPDITFSQLFFLVKGMLAIYDCRTKTIQTLPGADDPGYVQTNGTWSPDGKFIVFARSRSPAYDPPSLRRHASVVVPPQEADEFLRGGQTFLFDLYRIPFNEGKGGKAEPLLGASNNGMSNYFAKYSPDGKWIVFCKARSFMLLQPDSELYIVPAEGGEARRLRCNTGRMNSWHSWSPNGKWLVFSSKAFSPYTQLLLTHIDEQGESTPPVVLENFTEKGRAANIPEFVNARPDAIKNIREAFLDDTNYVRVGDEFSKQGEHANAIPWFRKAVNINPNNAAAHLKWGTSLLSLGNFEEAKEHLALALALRPDWPETHCGLGIALRQQRRLPEAAEAYARALRQRPDFALAHLHLGQVLLDLGRFAEAETHLAEAVRLVPRDPFARLNLARACGVQQKWKEGAAQFTEALKWQADFVPALVGLALIRSTSKDATLRDGPQAVALATRACELTRRNDPEALYALAAAYAESGRYADAASTADAALGMAMASGNRPLVESLRRLRATCRQRSADSPPSPGAK